MRSKNKIKKELEFSENELGIVRGTLKQMFDNYRERPPKLWEREKFFDTKCTVLKWVLNEKY